MNSTKSRGFTLIEVLVASTILFLVIAGVVQIANNSLLLNNKISNEIKIHSYIPLVIKTIESQIRPFAEQKTEYRSSFDGLDVRWSIVGKTDVVSSFQAGSASDTDVVESTPVKLVLFTLKVELTLGVINRTFEVSKIGWIQNE